MPSSPNLFKSYSIGGGAPLEGIRLYPILHYPGWDNDRHCECGPPGPIDGEGRPAIGQPLADELHREQAICANLFGAGAKSTGAAAGVAAS